MRILKLKQVLRMKDLCFQLQSTVEGTTGVMPKKPIIGKLKDFLTIKRPATMFQKVIQM